jgi:hypothetical protein
MVSLECPLPKAPLGRFQGLPQSPAPANPLPMAPFVSVRRRVSQRRSTTPTGHDNSPQPTAPMTRIPERQLYIPRLVLNPRQFLKTTVEYIAIGEVHG